MKKTITTIFTVMIISTTAFADNWVCNVLNEVGGSDNSYDSHLMPSKTKSKASLEEAISDVARVINSGQQLQDVCGLSDAKFFDSIKTLTHYTWNRSFRVDSKKKPINSKISSTDFEDFFEFEANAIDLFKSMKQTANPEDPQYGAACHFECEPVDVVYY